MDKSKVAWKVLSRRENKKRHRKESSFESASIGDMAFLLLIFFIVTGSFILRQGIFFSLPSKTAGAIRMADKDIIEVYPKNEGFLYNNRLIGRAEFKKELALHRERSPEGVLIIRMKKDVMYDRLVDTLSAARETGVKKVSLKNAEGK